MPRYPSVTDPIFLAQLKSWLALDGEIYVNVYFVRTAGVQYHMLIRSFDAFMGLLPFLEDKFGAITVLRRPVFSTRGIANEALLKNAISRFPDGANWFLICPDDKFPYKTVFWGDNSHVKMQELFQQVMNRFIVMGDDVNFPPQETREDVLVADFGRK